MIYWQYLPETIYVHINKNNVMFICTNDMKTKQSNETFKYTLLDIIKI